jgi:hypothetical protein
MPALGAASCGQRCPDQWRAAIPAEKECQSGLLTVEAKDCRSKADISEPGNSHYQSAPASRYDVVH